MPLRHHGVIQGVKYDNLWLQPENTQVYYSHDEIL